MKKSINTCISWTRSITLILSLIVTVLTLIEYNYNALPLSSLLLKDNNSLDGKQLLHDMIRDRRLIATLVAAQASIFCTLFLIITNSKSTIEQEISVWRTVFEKFCYFLTPLNLATSWLFSIIFDKKTLVAYYSTSTNIETNLLWDLVIYLEHSLKYIIMGVLCIEMIAIWISCYLYTRTQPIQLQEEEEEEEKVLYI